MNEFKHAKEIANDILRKIEREKRIKELCMELRNKLNDLHHDMWENVKDEDYQFGKDVRLWFYHHISKQALHCFLREHKKENRSRAKDDLLKELEVEMREFEKQLRQHLGEIG